MRIRVAQDRLTGFSLAELDVSCARSSTWLGNADYAKRFTCISVDPRGAGESDKPQATYSTELFADDIAAFMQTIGVEGAHVSGLSLGAASRHWHRQLGDTRFVNASEKIGAGLHATACRRRGCRTVNSVKSPTSLSNVIVPPCCWVMIS